MDNDIIKKMTIEEAKKYLNFINPNNFDEYHAMVLPKSNFNYTYVSRESVLFANQESKPEKKNNRKNPNPQKLILPEITYENLLDDSESGINKSNADNPNYNKICEEYNLKNAKNFTKRNRNSGKNLIFNNNDENYYSCNKKKKKELSIYLKENNVSSSLKNPQLNLNNDKNKENECNNTKLNFTKIRKNVIKGNFSKLKLTAKKSTKTIEEEQEGDFIYENYSTNLPRLVQKDDSRLIKNINNFNNKNIYEINNHKSTPQNKKNSIELNKSDNFRSKGCSTKNDKNFTSFHNKYKDDESSGDFNNNLGLNEHEDFRYWRDEDRKEIEKHHKINLNNKKKESNPCRLNKTNEENLSENASLCEDEINYCLSTNYKKIKSIQKFKENVKEEDRAINNYKNDSFKMHSQNKQTNKINKECQPIEVEEETKDNTNTNEYGENLNNKKAENLSFKKKLRIETIEENYLDDEYIPKNYFCQISSQENKKIQSNFTDSRNNYSNINKNNIKKNHSSKECEIGDIQKNPSSSNKQKKNVKCSNKSIKSVSNILQNSYKSYQSHYFNCEGIDVKPDHSNVKCIVCDWNYPNEMSIDEKNAHINFCVEGQGEKHKSNFLSSMKLIKMAIQEDNNKNSVLKLNKNKLDKSDDDKITNVCPFCNKTIYLRNNKTIDSHLFECYSQQEQEILLTNKKRKKC